MLTNHFIKRYNQLIATSILYFTMADPLRELANKQAGLADRQTPQNHDVIQFAYAGATVDKNHYDILGVQRGATKQEIHRAFRQLAKKYHPDKNKGDEAQDEFIRISRAYETLSDDKKRRGYDDQLDAGSGNLFGGSWQQGPATMADFDIHELFKRYEDQFMKQPDHDDQNHHSNHQHQYQAHDWNYRQESQPNHNEQKFAFHGINLDNLMYDIGQDDMSSFGRLFNGLKANNQNHYHLHKQAMDGSFGDGTSFFSSHDFSAHLHGNIPLDGQDYNFPSGDRAGSYSCQTTTKQVNGMMMTQTSCF